jgi:hypothetical protein
MEIDLSTLSKGVFMFPRSRLVAFALTFLLIISACNLPTAATPTVLPPLPTGTDLPATQPAPATSTLSATGTLLPEPTFTQPAAFTVTVSPTASPVTITASTGNLNVRRGPGVGYNPIGGLLKGEAAVATGRDYRGDWLYVTLPSQPDKSGWVNSQTKFSTVTGDVMGLSVMEVAPPKPAYFRNCTFHSMLVEPGGVVIPPQGESPLNEVQFNPGEYQVKDDSVAGSPTVMEATLLEGYTIDIRTDGIPNTYSCP